MDKCVVEWAGIKLKAIVEKMPWQVDEETLEKCRSKPASDPEPVLLALKEPDLLLPPLRKAASVPLPDDDDAINVMPVCGMICLIKRSCGGGGSCL
jgi:hypothetical protein